MPPAARRHMMSSISSLALLIRRHWYRQTYGADQGTPSGNSAISRRETYTETNQDLRRTTTCSSSSSKHAWAASHHIWNCSFSLHLIVLLSTWGSRFSNQKISFYVLPDWELKAGHSLSQVIVMNNSDKAWLAI